MTVQQSAGRRTRPAAQQNRLPSSRERRPALAALAVLLIVGGALASGWLALRSGQRAEFLVLRSEVAQGQRLDASDLGTVSLPEDSTGLVPATSARTVVGEYAATRLLPGTILTPSMVVPTVQVPAGMAQVAVVLPETQLPAGLQAGDTVRLTSVPTDGNARYLHDATVVAIARPGVADSGFGGGGGTLSSDVSITLLVPIAGDPGEPSPADAVAQASAAGDLSIARIPPRSAG